MTTHIEINNFRLDIRAPKFDEDVFDFITDDPDAQTLQHLYYMYETGTNISLNIGGIITNVKISMLLPFDNHKGMSYNIRMDHHDNA